MRRVRAAWHVRAPRGGDATHDCTAVRVPKYHAVRKAKKVFIVIFVVALAAGVKSKPSSRERLFLRTANPKRAAAHRRPGPEL